MIHTNLLFNSCQNSFPKETEFSAAILSCGEFKIEDKITAGRVAEAFNKYVFFVGNFKKLAQQLGYEKKEEWESPIIAEIMDNHYEVCFQTSGLETLLQRIEVIKKLKSDVANVKILLEVKKHVLTNLATVSGGLTESEQLDQETINKLLMSSNSISNGSMCMQILQFLVQLCLLVVIGAILSFCIGKTS